MIVSELIEKLKELDQDARVIVVGHDHGSFMDIEPPESKDVVYDKLGIEPYRSVRTWMDNYPEADETTVLICRTGRFTKYGSGHNESD